MANSQITQPEPIRMLFAKGTDIGRQRGQNEDYVDAFSPPDPAQRRLKGQLFIVADGMGGHQAGEVASRNAVEAISHEYYADPERDVASSLVHAIQRANALIYQQAQESPFHAGMGTTVVAAVVRGEELCLANVGDSRAYLMRNGAIRQVTRDHSFVEEQIRAGILTREEARRHPQRNVITRALGAKPDIEVDTYKGSLVPGDTLLLCTDGLSEYVQEGEIQAILGQHLPQDAIPRLIALANERGGNDNITALVLQAAPVAMTGRLEDTTPVTPQPKDTSRRGLSLPLIAGLSAGGLLLVAAAVIGILSFTPILGGGHVPATPTAMVMAPKPTASATKALPAATLLPTRGAPTATLVPDLELLEPREEATFAPGTEVTFRWEVIGILPDSFGFVVRTSQPGYEEICRSEQEACVTTLEAEGKYEWWAELLHGGRSIVESKPRTLYVRATVTPALTATLSLTPSSPIATPDSTAGQDG